MTYIRREDVLMLARKGSLISNSNYQKVKKMIEDIEPVNVVGYEVIEDYGIIFDGLSERMIEDEDRVFIYTDKSLKEFKLTGVSRYKYMCGVCKFYKNDRCENPLSKKYAIHVSYDEGCPKWIDEREGEEE